MTRKPEEYLSHMPSRAPGNCSPTDIKRPTTTQVAMPCKGRVRAEGLKLWAWVVALSMFLIWGCQRARRASGSDFALNAKTLAGIKFPRFPNALESAGSSGA